MSISEIGDLIRSQVAEDRGPLLPVAVHASVGGPRTPPPEREEEPETDLKPHLNKNGELTTGTPSRFASPIIEEPQSIEACSHIAVAGGSTSTTIHRAVGFVAKVFTSFAFFSSPSVLGGLSAGQLIQLPEDMLDDVRRTQLVNEYDSKQIDDLINVAAYGTPCARAQQKLSRAYALVTRKMKSDEKISEKGKGARASEMRKLAEQYELFDVPEERSDVAISHPTATVCPMAMLCHVKNAEKQIESQVFKGRCVILGDQLRSLGNVQISAWWESWSSQVAALEEVRIIDTIACIRRYKIETVDLESAYLQAAWPDNVPYHYISLPADLVEFLPSHLKGKNLRYPIWRMLRAGYGHPASGHIWNAKLEKFLIRSGWEPASPGSRSLFIKDNLILATYVDDLKCAGPDDELCQFWKDLGNEFKLKDPFCGL